MKLNITDLKGFLQKYGSFVVVMLILLFAGGGGFYQLTSGLFYCGTNAAMPEIFYWTIVISIQCAVFIAIPVFKSAKNIYLYSQIIALPFVVFVLAQLADTYPRPFIIIGALFGIYCYLRFLTTRFWLKDDHYKQELNFTELLAEGSIFILTTLLIHTTFAFLLLHTQGMRLTDSWFLGIFLFSLILSYFLVRKSCSFFRIELVGFPPLFLLVFILLRAKLPDQAYDSLFYKATIPLMIADWRTALTGVLDHTLLGTNLLEIINSQIRILDPSYSPALITSFAFIGLWIIAPQIATSFSQTKDDNLVKNASILLIISLTEPLTAAGTAYQEPFLILLIVVSTLAGPLGWFMIASAVSVKITTLFFIPLWLLCRAMTNNQEYKSPLITNIIKILQLPVNSFAKYEQPPNHIKSHNKYITRIVFVICLFLAFTIVGEQFYRNYIFTGRIFAPSESLVSITDPNGETLKRSTENQVFDVVSDRNKLVSLGTTVIHMLTLDKLIKPDELGFHIIPSSRLPIVALLICIFFIAFKDFRNNKYFVFLIIGYAVSFLIFLSFFSQGRHMAAASVFAIFVIIATLNILIKLIKKESHSSILLPCMAFGVAFLAVSDQMVGSYINNGWECGRPLLAIPIRSEYENSKGDVEKVLTDIVQRYRINQGTNNGAIPSILCEPQIERRAYFGSHYVYSYTSQSMLKNYLDVNSERVERLPSSLLVICFENEKFFTDLVPPHIRPQFEQFSKVGKISFMVSTRLLSGTIAESITKKSFSSLQFFTSKKFVAYNFVEKWFDGNLTDKSHFDTPNGKGALRLNFDGTESAVLISPNSIQFSNILFEANDSIELEYAMPYHNSDGMEVRLTIITTNKEHTVELIGSPRSGENAPINWKKETIKLPSELTGEGLVVISAQSASGNSNADWIAFRNLIIQRSF